MNGLPEVLQGSSDEQVEGSKATELVHVSAELRDTGAGKAVNESLIRWGDTMGEVSGRRIVMAL